jgi:glutamate-5-semialdehyde dehydrogenase
VLYVDASADAEQALELVRDSLDRLGVCNRLNLLLVHRDLWDSFVPRVESILGELGVQPSLPPHDHPIGHEWATDDGNEANVTIAPAGGVDEAADIANETTSGLAAGIAAADAGAAGRFMSRYRGTGAFWNTSTRWLDGFKLLQAPETGINIDRVPGPRGPVTYRDLYLRQWRVTPLEASPAAEVKADPGERAAAGDRAGAPART